MQAAERWTAVGFVQRRTSLAHRAPAARSDVWVGKSKKIRNKKLAQFLKKKQFSKQKKLWKN